MCTRVGSLMCGRSALQLIYRGSSEGADAATAGFLTLIGIAAMTTIYFKAPRDSVAVTATATASSVGLSLAGRF